MRRGGGCAGDRLFGVDDEVQEHLLELGEHGQRLLRRLLVDDELDLLLVQPALAELDDRRDDLAHRGRRGHGALLAAEAREVADDAARAGALLADEREVVAHVG